MKRLEGHLTRAELARSLGKSKTTVRRWEAKGLIKPIVDEHGVHLFRVEDARRLNGGEPLETLPRARAYVAGSDRASGELSAQVFELLNAGVEPVEIVTRLRVHPQVLQGFLASWAQLRRVYVLDDAQVRAIERALGVAIRGSESLVREAQRIVERMKTCRICHKSAPVHCYGCVTRGIEKARADERKRYGMAEAGSDDEGRDDNESG